MVTPAFPSSSDVWRLDGSTAVLQTPQFSAVVDLMNPQAGLSQLVYNNLSVASFVLGVTPGASSHLAGGDVADVFQRGSDLVVNYAETQRRPFSLQVYWRATARQDGVVLLDTILSLQTDLLESFPGLAVETNLASSSVWHIPGAGDEPTKINLTQGQQCRLPTGESDGILLQSTTGGWSYAEMTHPEDRGGGRVQRPEQDAHLLHRRLGGGFLEKGVIRRLRVRGVFMPRENDLQLATDCLASLATEQPPLTV